MMTWVNLLPTQRILTRTRTGWPYRKFASSTGTAECLNGATVHRHAVKPNGDYLGGEPRVVAGWIRLGRLL
jgi:hypothetical protein